MLLGLGIQPVAPVASLMPAMEPFNPAIDRYDRRSVARLSHLLWPDNRVTQSVVDNLAAPIRVAHAAGDACWEVTMYPDGLRLNVGQVETLTLREEVARYLFQFPCTSTRISGSRSTPHKARSTPRFRSRRASVKSPRPDLVALPVAIRTAHEAYIRAAASFKRGSPFKRSHSPAVIEYVESALATTLPQPRYAPTRIA